MTTHVYLSVIPEALIVSMLPPEDFGLYYAVGTRQRSRGQAMFFEVDPALASLQPALEQARRRCVPHSDGRPKNSVYASIYRALERVPLNAFGALYLTTDDGRVLELESRKVEPEQTDTLHLYQEFCPITPRVVSRLAPLEFSRFITGPDLLIAIPRLVFCDLKLDGLAEDPVDGEAQDLPYPHLQHLRDCLSELRTDTHKVVKMVMRNAGGGIVYRTIRNGFFVGDASGLLYYPMPSQQTLEQHHRDWWRSALMSSLD